MPYKLVKSGRGYQVAHGKHRFSKRPLTKRQAQKQMAALYFRTGGK